MYRTPVDIRVEIRMRLDNAFTESVAGYDWDGVKGIANNLASAYNLDWRKVAESLKSIATHATGNYDFLFNLAANLILEHTESAEALRLELKDLNDEIAWRDAQDLSSAWCGEQDAFGDKTDRLREERQALAAHLATLDRS